MAKKTFTPVVPENISSVCLNCGEKRNWRYGFRITTPNGWPSLLQEYTDKRTGMTTNRYRHSVDIYFCHKCYTELYALLVGKYANPEYN